MLETLACLKKHIYTEFGQILFECAYFSLGLPSCAGHWPERSAIGTYPPAFELVVADLMQDTRLIREDTINKEAF